MFFSERKDKIVEILKSRGSASVHVLANELYVSEPTVRRDLAELEQEGKLKRTFGGAVYCERVNFEIPLSLRKGEETAAKKLIAEKVAKYLRDGQAIFLDASSTVTYLVDHIEKFENITVITNSPKLSLMLAERKFVPSAQAGYYWKTPLPM